MPRRNPGRRERLHNRARASARQSRTVRPGHWFLDLVEAAGHRNFGRLNANVDRPQREAAAGNAILNRRLLSNHRSARAYSLFRKDCPKLDVGARTRRGTTFFQTSWTSDVLLARNARLGGRVRVRSRQWNTFGEEPKVLKWSRLFEQLSPFISGFRVG